MLAGMAAVSNAELAAAVSNAGGLGVIGGAFISPAALRKTIKKLKSLMNDANAPFGVDLLLPKVGSGARKTNYDYTHGSLEELVDICIEEGAKLFIAAVGIPPKWVVDKFHAHGVLVMNMVGSPKHVIKALEVGIDGVIAQGTEAGGHTGDVATMPLIPQCVDLCKGKKSPLHGGPISVVGAGGIFDGRGLVAALALGAQCVWIGTRFVASKEAGASPRHQSLITTSMADDTIRTTIFSGRPMRVHKSDYVLDWETQRQEERDALLASGKRPYKTDLTYNEEKGTPLSFLNTYPSIYGQACGGINDVKPAGDIVESMVKEALEVLQSNAALVSSL
jgi:NAD(P)H-dependent flavin oxidoreductase YrpB (nitropropane dioxygenase family)